jgi:(p)ppGpp synthase/HD superfamily hydrolase
MSMLSLAIGIATASHEGQTDKAGQPYILHVLRVGASGKTEAEQIVGFLHDVLEDTVYPRAVIQAAFTTEIMDAVDVLNRRTMRRDKTYADYIFRVSGNPLAKVVKINDLRDNLRRLDSLPYSEAESLLIRYRRALVQLGVEEV